jgi:hypothetical protein
VRRGRTGLIRWLALAAAIGASAATRARAADAFEIQVYDGSANPPGRMGIELHLNSVLSGRREATPPELPPHHQTHATLEPALGITPWWELGAYLQSALLPDGTYHYAGAKLRTKFMRPYAPAHLARLGVNLELARIQPAYEADRWGTEIRPFVAWTAWNGRLSFAVNPILDIALTGDDRTPAFEPALSAVYVFESLLSIGVEYYASLGPITGWLPVAQQEHTLFEVINVLAWQHWELNVGIGEGLTDASNPLVGKLILGFSP